MIKVKAVFNNGDTVVSEFTSKDIAIKVAIGYHNCGAIKVVITNGG